VIFRLCLTARPLDSEPDQVLAQPRERPVKQEPSEVIGLVGHQFPAPEADEEVKIFSLNIIGAGTTSGFRDRSMGAPQWARVSTQTGEALEQALIRCAREKRREERIFPRPRRIDLIDVTGIDVTGMWYVTGM
jgi:hypothetical protein